MGEGHDIGDQMPRPAGPTFGRRAELDEVVASLRPRASGRFVSLVGAGGVGKTRLAVEAARRLAPTLTDGVTYVPLAGVDDPAEVPSAIATALRLAGATDAPVPEALRRGLREHERLLVLDNFEQVVAAGPLVADLATAGAGLRILVTSRIPLGVDAERCIELGPLDLPAPDAELDDAALARLGEVPAVALFVARASAVDERFGLTAENAEAVVAACRRLGGSPLEIELAAARVRLLSMSQLLDLLGEDPLGVLAAPDTRRPDRQRSARATIGWSFDLLAPEDREVLCRLGAFEHGFSFEAAVAVVDRAPGDVLDALDRLVDAHLVMGALGGRADAPRLAMPVPVRDFARERLRAEGGWDVAFARLVAQQVARGEEVAVEVETVDEQACLDDVEVELDQIRIVLAHLRTHDPTAALRLASALGSFWLHRGFLGEGRRHLAAALDPDVATVVEKPVLAAALAWEARLAADQGVVGDHPGAGAMLDQLTGGLAVARAVGDVDAELRCLDFLSHVLVLHDDDVRPAVAVTEEGIALARRTDRPWWLAQLVQRAAVFSRLQGDLDRAAVLAAEAWALARQLGADRLVLHAGLTVVQLPPDERVADPPDLASLHDLATRLRDERLTATVAMSLGIDAMLAGEAAEAAGYFQRAVEVGRDTGYWHAIGFSLMCSSAFAATQADTEACARLHGSARAVIPVLRRGMPPAYFDLYNDLVAGARAALGPDRFDRLAEVEARLGWDHAASTALRLLVPISATRPSPPGVDSLTRREREVLACLVEGSSNKEIAQQLDIATKTVMHHTVSIYRKLGAKGRAEAAAMGERFGLSGH